MLMRSPVHPSLMRWVLRPAPVGRHRLAVAYLTAAAGSVVGLLIFAVGLRVAHRCQVAQGQGQDPVDGFSCLSPLFHGIGLAVVACAVVTLGLSIFTKLGIGYVAGLVAFTAPVLLVTQLLSIFGAEPRPYALIALLAVPAAASGLTALLREGSVIPSFPRRVVARASAAPRTRTAAITLGSATRRIDQ